MKPKPVYKGCNIKTGSEPGRVAQLVGALPWTPKGCGFDALSGPIPGLQVRSLVAVHTGGNQLMVLSLSCSFPSSF